MITSQQYFWQKEGNPECTPAICDAADRLLGKVNALVEEAVADGAFVEEIDPDTGSTISGARGGAGDGGFRLSGSTTGSKLSAHKRGRAVDKYDPRDSLDRWLDRFEIGNGMNTKLREYGLHREAPHATPGWCHLQDIAPGSGRDTFNP